MSYIFNDPDGFQSSQLFWSQVLQGFNTPTSLPFRSKPANYNTLPSQLPIASGEDESEDDSGLGDKSCGYGKVFLHCPPGLYSRVIQFLQDEALDWHTLFQGVWAILLSRYSGEKDILFGVQKSFEPSELDQSHSHGKALPLRVQCSDTTTVLELLVQVQDQWHSIQKQSDLDSSEIQACSDVPQDIPLYESCLRLVSSGSGVLAHPIPEHSPLVIAIDWQVDSASFVVFYDRQQFQEVDIQRLAGHVHTVLEGIVTSPHCPYVHLPLLTEAERHQVLEEWNNTEVPIDSNCYIHHWIEAQTEKTPGAIAVVFEGKTLTYQELNDRANQLAHHLQNLGVCPESLVGLYLERSLEMVVAILGILKAGGGLCADRSLQPPGANGLNPRRFPGCGGHYSV